MKLHVQPEPPSSQAGLEARLEGLLAELECLTEHMDGQRARSYAQTAQQALWKAVTLARQGL